jgi:GNAT superfamily N-acetyltransferase
MSNPHENLHRLYDFLHLKGTKIGKAGPYYSWLQDKGTLRPWPSRIYRPAPDMPVAAMKRLRDGVLSGALPGELQVESVAEQAGNLERLKELGFQELLRFPAMSLRSDQYTVPKPCELDITPVLTPDHLHEWSKLVGGGFWKMGAEAVNLLDELYLPLLGETRLTLTLGLIRNQPVATTMVFLSRESGGVYLVYVDPAHRRVGVGSAMMAEAIRRIFDHGCERVILQASRAGEPLYRKLGFVTDFDYTIQGLRPKQPQTISD